jgi:Rrf2 family nitric oxide-sensitive transcriptional repressor
MQLTQYTDYSIRVLIHVGLTNEKLSTTQQISDRYAISRNHLMKVVYHLNLHGFLETVRGKNGGIRLGMPPEKINIGHVIRCTENTIALTACQSNENHCRISAGCILHNVLDDALATFFSVVDRYTLADLLQPRDDMVQLLGLDADEVSMPRIPLQKVRI